MRHIIFAVLISLALATLAYWAFTHDNLKKVDHLSKELERLNNENLELQQRNDTLKRRIRALKDDYRLAERRARQDSNLVRSDEIVFQFKGKTKRQTVAVILNVTNDSATLAGRPVTEESFEQALNKLKREIPGATLKLNYEKDLDPIRKQFFDDIIQRNSFDRLP